MNNFYAALGLDSGPLSYSAEEACKINEVLSDHGLHERNEGGRLTTRTANSPHYRKFIIRCDTQFYLEGCFPMFVDLRFNLMEPESFGASSIDGHTTTRRGVARSFQFQSVIT